MYTVLQLTLLKELISFYNETHMHSLNMYTVLQLTLLKELISSYNETHMHSLPVFVNESVNEQIIWREKRHENSPLSSANQSFDAASNFEIYPPISRESVAWRNKIYWYASPIFSSMNHLTQQAVSRVIPYLSWVSHLTQQAKRRYYNPVCKMGQTTT